MILNFLTLLVMFIGLMFTLTPRMPGTIIIACTAACYGLITDFSRFTPALTFSLGILVFIGEVSSRQARVYLTRKFPVSILFSTDATAGNIAGVLATDALFGPILGTLIWELIVGKTLFPRFDIISQVLIRLAVVAFLRFVCGIAMVFIIAKYIML